jgi:hypothetical protein
MRILGGTREIRNREKIIVPGQPTGCSGPDMKVKIPGAPAGNSGGSPQATGSKPEDESGVSKVELGAFDTQSENCKDEIFGA